MRSESDSPGTVHRIALTVLAFWVLFALVSPLFAPWGFHESENIIIAEGEGPDGSNLYLFSPHPPSARHPLGTDEYGYDYLSTLLYGSRYTLFFTLITAALRTGGGFFIGSRRALQALQGGKPARNLSNTASTTGKFSLISGLPVFVILYFIQYSFIINPDTGPMTTALIQGFLVTVFGIPATIPLFRDRTEIILQEPFIEAAMSGGGSRRWIFRHHVVPHLLEDLYVSFSQEIVAVLTILGQLGIFSIFIGGTRFTRDPPELTSITREWGGLIGRYLGKVGSSDWWLIVCPLAAYLLLYFSAFAVSRLFEREVEKTYHLARYL